MKAARSSAASWAQAAGDDQDGGAGGAGLEILQEGDDGGEVVGQEGMAGEGQAQAGQTLGEPGDVGVDDVAGGEFGADGERFCIHLLM